MSETKIYPSEHSEQVFIEIIYTKQEFIFVTFCWNEKYFAEKGF